jgi:thioredoxin-like negative regulator of GroEL
VCQRGSRNSPIKVESMEELLSYIKSCGAALVTFYSPACPYCRAFEPIYAEAAHNYGKLLPFLRVNTWTLPEAAYMFGVMGVPMTIGITRGEPAAVLYGYGDYDEILQLIEETLKRAGCTKTN